MLKDICLTSKIKTSNLMLYKENDILTKYKSPKDILMTFYKNRLFNYKERKIKVL